MKRRVTAFGRKIAGKIFEEDGAVTIRDKDGGDTKSSRP